MGLKPSLESTPHTGVRGCPCLEGEDLVPCHDTQAYQGRKCPPCSLLGVQAPSTVPGIVHLWVPPGLHAVHLAVG